MAVEQREAARGETVIHSDHGTQFTSWAFTESSHVRAGAIDGPHRRLQRQRADRSVVVTDADRAARHAPLDDARRTRRREKESLTSLSGDYGLVVSEGNERWSTYGAQRSQPVAIGGKWNARESGSKRRKPLPWVATSCLRRSMVRRGSPVRVRKRALQKRRITALFVSARFADRRTWGRYGALYGAFRSRTALRSRQKRRDPQVSERSRAWSTNAIKK
jgi:hypothetical protein